MPVFTTDSLPKRSALILYGSETGTAQDVAEEVGQMLVRLHFATKVVEMNSVDIDSLAQVSIVVFVASTTGQGDLPANGQTFWKSLLRRRLSATYLADIHFSTFGLGDSSYPKFNWAVRKLHKRLLQLGAYELFPRGEADAQHPEGADGDFIPWLSNLRRHLLEVPEYATGLPPILDDELLEPEWLLELVEGSKQSGVLLHSTVSASAISGTRQDSLSRATNGTIPGSGGATDAGSLPPAELLPIPGSLTVTVERNERVTPMDHWQDVRSLSLSSAFPVEYSPGDVLTIFPKNFPEDVEQFISLLGWEDVADRPVRFAPTRSSNLSHDQPPIPHLVPDLTLRNLLTHHLDINAIPRRSFFSLIAHFTNEEAHKERLLEFTKPEYLDELYDYTTRPRRSHLEVLQEFQSVKVPWTWAARLIPALKGRQFSIASGGCKKISSQESAPARFELLVAIVRYRTVIRSTRRGVCTRYIASLQPGARINILLRKGGLGVSKTEMSRPVVMVAPGTGVAPMRSMLWERLQWFKDAPESENAASTNGHASSQAVVGKSVLFFGCRNEEADYFYRDEWEYLERQMDLEVYAAFSRDQRSKIYVQDLIRQQAELVYQLLHEQSGLVYICGSSGKMPQAVREALIEVFQGRGGIDRPGAEAYLLKMEKEGRYKQETW
ncbi:MAG: hypothetical protein M1823_003022 [Watsoniomyces obsoletus]|nr:MAG: hypothetical protein M1823_003022 [Watsoniomyces obsoletus]